jgi:hypothetical protein
LPALPFIAAGIGAVGTVYAASKASSAAGKAADAQVQSDQAAIGEQRREYDQSRADYAPWRQIGVGALQQLARTENIQLPGDALSGASYGFSGAAAPNGTATVNGQTVHVGTAPANPTSGTRWIDYSSGQPVGKVYDQSEGRWGTPNAQQIPQWFGTSDLSTIKPTSTAAQGPAGTMAPQYGDFAASPDYKFRYDEGQRAVTGNAAARGLLDSGATGHALINYGQDAASQEFGSWYNRIAALAGVGQSATNATTEAGLATSGRTSGLIQDQGQARASSYAAQGGIQAGLISGLAGTASGLITNLGQRSAAAGPSVQIPNISAATIPFNPGFNGASSPSLFGAPV